MPNSTLHYYLSFKIKSNLIFFRCLFIPSSYWKKKNVFFSCFSNVFAHCSKSTMCTEIWTLRLRTYMRSSRNGVTGKHAQMSMLTIKKHPGFITWASRIWIASVPRYPRLFSPLHSVLRPRFPATLEQPPSFVSPFSPLPTLPPLAC